MRYGRKEILFSIVLIPITILSAWISLKVFFIAGSFSLSVWARHKFNRREWCFLIVFDLFLFLGIFTENIKFEFLPQAYALLKSNTNLLHWFYSGHIHAVRLLVAYPGYLLSLVGKVELNIGFTIYVGLIFELLFIITCRVLKIYVKEIKGSGLVIGGALLGLSIVMNGRIIFAFLGLLIILYQDVCLFQEKTVCRAARWIGRCVGLLFTTVSSGTMLLTFGYICLIFIVRYLFVKSRKDKLKIVVKGSLVCIATVPIWSRMMAYLIRMANKNLSYFGGGVKGLINMLNHGIGRIIYVSDSSFHFIYLVVLAGIMIVNILLFGRLVIQKQWDKVPLFLAVNLGVYGFGVGISTGTMMILPFLLLILIQISSRERGGMCYSSAMVYRGCQGMTSGNEE